MTTVEAHVEESQPVLALSVEETGSVEITTEFPFEKDQEGRTIVKSERFKAPLKMPEKEAVTETASTAKTPPKIALNLESPRAIEACMRQVPAISSPDTDTTSALSK